MLALRLPRDIWTILSYNDLAAVGEQCWSLFSLIHFFYDISPSYEAKQFAMVILSAPWIVPVDGQVIKDGAVVVDGEFIVAVGKRDDILKIYGQVPERPYYCVLMPGLVNAHMHLELSLLHEEGGSVSRKIFTDWIEALIAKKAELQLPKEKVEESIFRAMEEQHRQGVVLIGDIGNDYFEELHVKGANLEPRLLRMLELLGPNRQASRAALKTLAKLDDHLIVTGHAPYSTGPELLGEIKRRSRALQQVFSIHTAESGDEVEFVQTGTGAFRDFLERRGSWDGQFSLFEDGFLGSVHYLDSIGLLDEKTLLVHCVHLREDELRLIKKRGAHICLCPGSNRYLGVGTAQVKRMVELGLLPALGTDSLASNETLDIWREMQIIASYHGGLDNSSILAMATLGGSRALGYDKELGTLTAGKRAQFIHVYSAKLKSCDDRKQLVKELVSGGRPTDISWVSTGAH